MNICKEQSLLLRRFGTMSVMRKSHVEAKYGIFRKSRRDNRGFTEISF
jgi:hypothetical protein